MPERGGTPAVPTAGSTVAVGLATGPGRPVSVGPAAPPGVAGLKGGDMMLGLAGAGCAASGAANAVAASRRGIRKLTMID